VCSRAPIDLGAAFAGTAGATAAGGRRGSGDRGGGVRVRGPPRRRIRTADRDSRLGSTVAEGITDHVNPLTIDVNPFTGGRAGPRVAQSDRCGGETVSNHRSLGALLMGGLSLGLTALAVFLGFVWGTSAAPALTLNTGIQAIRDAYHLSASDAALPGSLALAATALSLMFLSFVGDRFDRRYVMLVALAAIGIMTAAVDWAAPNYAWLVAIGVGIGAGGLFEALVRPLLARGLTKDENDAIAAPTSAGFVLAYNGWRIPVALMLPHLGLNTFVVVGVTVALFGGLVVKFVRPDPVKDRDEAQLAAGTSHPSWALVALVGVIGGLDTIAWGMPIFSEPLLVQGGLGSGWLAIFLATGVVGLFLPLWRACFNGIVGAYAGTVLLFVGLVVLWVAAHTPLGLQGWVATPGFASVELANIAIWTPVIARLGGGSRHTGAAVGLRVLGVAAGLWLAVTVYAGREAGAFFPFHIPALGEVGDIVVSTTVGVLLFGCIWLADRVFAARDKAAKAATRKEPEPPQELMLLPHELPQRIVLEPPAPARLLAAVGTLQELSGPVAVNASGLSEAAGMTADATDAEPGRISSHLDVLEEEFRRGLAAIAAARDALPGWDKLRSDGLTAFHQWTSEASAISEVEGATIGLRPDRDHQAIGRVRLIQSASDDTRRVLAAWAEHSIRIKLDRTIPVEITEAPTS
jgi:hypothetical protein